MPKFNVSFTRVETTDTDVEAADWKEAIEKARDVVLADGYEWDTELIEPDKEDVEQIADPCSLCGSYKHNTESGEECPVTGERRE